LAISLFEGRNMEKKVWGIVLIVVAVGAILGGLSNYRDYSLVEGIVHNFGIDKQTRALIRNEQAYSIAWIGAGIILAVIGTMILSKVSPNRYIVQIEDEEDYIDSDEPKKNEPGGWKF
jgi:hypothetical protein